MRRRAAARVTSAVGTAITAASGAAEARPPVVASPAAIVADPPAHRRVDGALARSLAAMPQRDADEIGAAGRAYLAAALSRRLWNDARWPRGIVSPPPRLLRAAWRRLQQDDATPNDAPMRRAVLQVLANAMRRGCALRAHTGHIDTLQHLSNDDVTVLLMLDDAGQVATRLELQLDVLRDGLRWRRRVGMTEATAPSPIARSRFLPPHSGILERLGLMTSTDHILSIADAPAFSRHCEELKRGRFTGREALRRWLAGRHMATVHAPEGQPPPPTSVGALVLEYRLLSLTPAGQALADVVREPDIGCG